MILLLLLFFEQRWNFTVQEKTVTYQNKIVLAAAAILLQVGSKVFYNKEKGK